MICSLNILAQGNIHCISVLYCFICVLPSLLTPYASTYFLRFTPEFRRFQIRKDSSFGPASVPVLMHPCIHIQLPEASDLPGSAIDSWHQHSDRFQIFSFHCTAMLKAYLSRLGSFSIFAFTSHFRLVLLQFVLCFHGSLSICDLRLLFQFDCCFCYFSDGIINRFPFLSGSLIIVW